MGSIDRSWRPIKRGAWLRVIALLVAVGIVLATISIYSAGSRYVWARQLGGMGRDDGYDITVDGSANVYTTGFFENTVDFDPGPGLMPLTNVGSEDVFVIKLAQPQVRLVTSNQVQRSGVTVTITFMVENQGPDSADDTQINIPIPTNVHTFSWICTASDGAVCPAANGIDALNQTITTLPLGGRLIYIATGTIINPYQAISADGTFGSPDELNFTGSLTFRFGEYIMVLPSVLRAPNS